MNTDLNTLRRETARLSRRLLATDALSREDRLKSANLVASLQALLYSAQYEDSLPVVKETP